MTVEDKFAIWALGFSMGVMLVIGADRILETRTEDIPAVEEIRAITLIDMYKRGMSDALKTNPVSPALDSACLEIWSRRQ